MKPPTCFTDKSPSLGRHQYEGIYILLKHQLYIHNVKICNSNYKYTTVPNMDSLMLTYFWLQFISMPHFTMCVVTGTRTSSITVFDPEGSSPRGLYSCVLCRTVLYEHNKQRIVHVQRKKYKKGAKKSIHWSKLRAQTAFRKCFVFSILFLINHRWLHHFEHDSVICDPIWELMC